MRIEKLHNKQGIKEIEIEPSVCCYCPLGADWYNMKVNIKIKIDKYYPNYCDIRAFLNEEIQGKNLIIEDVLDKVYNFIKLYEPKELVVTGIVSEIESHPPVKVTKY